MFAVRSACLSGAESEAGTTSSRTGHAAAKVGIALVTLIVGGSGLQAMPVLVKAHALSIAVGEAHPLTPSSQTFWPIFDGRVLDVGVNLKPWPRIGVGIEATLLNGPGRYDMDEYTPSAGLLLTYTGSLKRSPHSTVAFAAVDAYPRIGVGIGASWTFWAVNLETELRWSRIQDDYIGVLFRVGLGGWFQFGDTEEASE